MRSASSQKAAVVSWPAVTIALLAAAALVVHATSYPFVTYDDAFISLRYAQRLLEGHGLTWTEGPPVEGYSNLLWVLGCAALGALGLPLPVAPVVLGIGSGFLLVSAVVYGFAPTRWNESLPAFGAALFIALAGPIGIWAVAGLEGCLVGALLAWAVVLLRPLLERSHGSWRQGLVPGIPLALLCLTRPDGPLITAAACVLLVAIGRSRDALARAVGVATLPLAATLGQVAFRLLYYGDWLPNTARAKVAFTAARLESGGACVAEAAGSAYALLIPAALSLYVAWRDEERRARIVLLVGLLATWVLYASSVTCQEFGYRMLIPCYVLLAFLVGEALAWIQEQGSTASAVAWVLTLALLAWFGRAQQRDKNIAIARWNDPPVTVQAETIGRVLGTAFGDDDPLVAVDAAGAIPFFSELRSLDMLGLNDAHIARHHDESFGRGVQGHELGDGEYVLSQEPDIIVAGVSGSSRLAFRGGREMEADPRFHERYRRARIFGDDPVPVRFNIHARLEGRAGVRRTENRVTIPGYLFARVKGTQARLDSENRLIAHFLAPVETRLDGVELDSGTWRLHVEGDGAPALVARGQRQGSTADAKGSELVITVDPRAPVDLAIRGATGATIRGVVAERVKP